MAATLLFSCNSNVIHGRRKDDPSFPRPFLGIRLRTVTAKRNQKHHSYGKKKLSHKFSVYAVTEGSAKSSKSEEKIPSWAKPDSDEPPPWAEGDGKEDELQKGLEIPFFVYLLASAVTAIAAVSLSSISFARIVFPRNAQAFLGEKLLLPMINRRFGTSVADRFCF